MIMILHSAREPALQLNLVTCVCTVATQQQCDKLACVCRLPSEAQLKRTDRACADLNGLTIGLRMSMFLADGIKMYNPDASSRNKMNLLAEVVNWQHEGSSTQVAYIGVRSIFRENREELRDRVVEPLARLEANAATALHLTHQARHGADMHPAQLRRLAAICKGVA